MTDDLPRCDECGARQVSHPERYNVLARLRDLGYIATDVYHDHADGQTYHGHAIDHPDADHDGFGEVLQNHDSTDAHETARETFAESAAVCPRHYETPVYTKSVAPTGDPTARLYAQGKCPTCECLVLVTVRDEG